MEKETRFVSEASVEALEPGSTPQDGTEQVCDDVCTFTDESPIVLPQQDRTEDEKQQKNKTPRKLHIFPIAFAAYIIFLIFAVGACLCSLYGLLREYEQSQPFNVAQAELTQLREAAAAGELSSCMALPGGQTEANYTKRMCGEALALHRKVGIYDQTHMVFEISDNDGVFAEIHLTSGKTVTKLGIFQITDWSADKVCMPTDGSGMYDITVPSSIRVFANGEEQKPVQQEDGQSAFKVDAAAEISLRDYAGNAQSYDPIVPLRVWQYTVTVPESCTVSAGEQNIPRTLAKEPETPVTVEAQTYLGEYCEDLHVSFLCYTFQLFSENRPITVTDADGSTATYPTKNNTLTLDAPAGSDTPGAGMPDRETILQVARTWSLLMTDDLDGNNHGYETMQQYLMPDSYISKVAWKWVNSIDITFINTHTLDDPPFSVEEVSHYVKWGENGFSCRVRLRKTLHMDGLSVEDETHATFYFAKKDGAWKLTGICDVKKEDAA